MIARLAFGAVTALLVWAAPLRAEPARLDDLISALRLPEMVAIMRAEALAQAEDLGADMLPTSGMAAWRGVADRLYDVDPMLAAVRKDLGAGLDGVDLDPLLRFFTSDTGQQVIGGELATRRAFLDPAVEAAARDSLPVPEDARSKAVEDFIAANDLIEMNVSGGLTASLRFYQGLAQGGQLDMTEAEMLDDIWAREDETRTESAAWVRALLTMAYRDVPVDGLRAYVDASLTPEGQALNLALFAGFDRMYGDLNHALGLALASRMAGDDL